MRTVGQNCAHSLLALHLHAHMAAMPASAWLARLASHAACCVCLLRPPPTGLPALRQCPPQSSLPTLSSCPPPPLASVNNDFALHFERRQRDLTSKRMVSRAYHDSLFMAQVGWLSICYSSTSNSTRQFMAASNESCRSFPRCKTDATALIGNVMMCWLAAPIGN